jgi:hypothetical protein
MLSLEFLMKFCFLMGPENADVAELVDALDLGSSGVTRGGSSPFIRTNLNYK